MTSSDGSVVPHDRLFRKVYGRPRHASSHLSQHLPAALARRIDVLDEYRRQHARDGLPVVLAILLHHSRAGWTGPTSLEARAREAADIEAELVEWGDVLDALVAEGPYGLEDAATILVGTPVAWHLDGGRYATSVTS